MAQRTARRTVEHRTVPSATRVPLRPAAEAYAVASCQGPLLPIAVPEVTLRPGEVLVAVELATLCEADLLSVSTGSAASPPRMLGHEQVGRVVAHGPGTMPTTIDGSPLALGDRVVWARRVRCGRCAACATESPSPLSTRCGAPDVYGHAPVRRGWELSGGVATHVHLRAHTAIARARDWVPASVLSLASCATATAVAAVESLGALADGARVVVSGCDAAGLTAIAILHARGAHVIAVDSRAGRRALAPDFGARDARHPDETPLTADALIDFTESASDPPRWTSAVGASTRVVRVAPHSVTPQSSGHPTGDPVRQVNGYHPDHLRTAIRFLERSDHELFARLVERIIPLRDARDVAAVTPLSGLRVGIRP